MTTVHLRWFAPAILCAASLPAVAQHALAIDTYVVAGQSNRWRISELKLLPGFVAERLYDVPKETQGSWVALGKMPDGRLIASDQGDAGIFLITPAPLDDRQGMTKVEKLDLPISGAQGFCWAFDSLYVNVNGNDSGVHRVTDTDGDGRLDSVRRILPLEGEGEHGPHAVIPAADGKSLLVAAGNFTRPPPITASRLPTTWQDDLLLPRLWTPGGFSRGLKPPGGWIARISPDAAKIEMISVGHRNQYDLAINHAGELFTYDADMEWDMGLPWYRPTRICHVTSGEGPL